MNKIVKTITTLLLGFIIYALAIVMMIHANIGLSPWDVLHQGISLNTGFTIGQVSICLGIIIIVIDAFMGENIGFATIGNVLLIGNFIDILENTNLIPYANNLFTGIIMMLIGIMLGGVASVLYLKPALGSGPRDGLMLAINKRSSKPIGTIRAIIEITVLSIGWLLGGSVGIGTIISGLGLGYAIQLGFKLTHVDPKKLTHKSVIESIREFKYRDVNPQVCSEAQED